MMIVRAIVRRIVVCVVCCCECLEKTKSEFLLHVKKLNFARKRAGWVGYSVCVPWGL